MKIFNISVCAVIYNGKPTDSSTSYHMPQDDRSFCYAPRSVAALIWSTDWKPDESSSYLIHPNLPSDCGLGNFWKTSSTSDLVKGITMNEEIGPAFFLTRKERRGTKPHVFPDLVRSFDISSVLTEAHISNDTDTLRGVSGGALAVSPRISWEKNWHFCCSF